MNRVNTILVAALAVQIALALLLRLTGSSDTIGDLEKLVNIEAETVTKIHIEGPSDSEGDGALGPITVAKTGESWVLESHYGYPVRSEQVDNFLSKVVGAESRQPIATTAPRLKQLKVADDDYERKVTLTHAGGETTFYLGGPAGGRRNAFRLSGSDEVHGVANLSPSAASLSPTLWAAAEYFKPEGEITSLGVDNSNGSFLFEKDGESYKVIYNGADVVPGPDQELDTSKIKPLFAKLRSLRMQEPAKADGAPTTGQITITVKTDKGEQYHLDTAIDGDKFHHVRDRDNANAVRVNKAVLEPFFELKNEFLKDKPADTGATTGTGADSGDPRAPAPTAPQQPAPLPVPPAHP